MENTAYDPSALLLTLMVFVLSMLGAEVGFRLGRRLKSGASQEAETEIVTIQAAVLGLLALLLGFTLSMTLVRYEKRRALVLDESNAIGTAWLRAALLPEPAATQTAAALCRYVDTRLEWVAAGTDTERTQQVSKAGDELLDRAWSIGTKVAGSDRRAVTTGLFIEAMNAVIDVKAKREMAYLDRVPVEVFLLLLFTTICGLGLTGYACGLSGNRNAGPTAAVALLVAIVICVMVDLHRPRQGRIRGGIL